MELKLIVGEQPPVLELPPQQGTRSVQPSCQAIHSVYAHDRKIAGAFLDDLQWLDSERWILLREIC